MITARGARARSGPESSVVKSLLHRYKPAARARTHLLAAALVWTVVGTALAGVGLHWCLGAASVWPAVLIAAGIAAGIVKARLVLVRAADRNADRVLARGDGRCLFGFLSWRGWLLVPAMMALGYALRHSPLPRPVVGLIYVAIGCALLAGSAPLWRARAAAP